MELEVGQWILFAFAALCIGFSKSGFSGFSIISIMILTELFGAKGQIGVGLPLLIVADITVFPAFRKHGNWREVWILLPPAIIGGIIGIWVLKSVDNEQMKPILAWVILLLVLMQMAKKWKPDSVYKLAMTKGFGVFAGLAGGLATVIANAAGPIQQLYLLSKKMEKMDMIGVGARFFLIVNILKLPIFGAMSMVSKETLLMNLYVVPLIFVGVYLGKKCIKKVPQKVFEYLVISFALVAALRLLLF